MDLKISAFGWKRGVFLAQNPRKRFFFQAWVYVLVGSGGAGRCIHVRVSRPRWVNVALLSHPMLPVLLQYPFKTYGRPLFVFTFSLLPLGTVVTRVCVFVCLCVNHEFFCAIICDPFKLQSPNLDQKCKSHWLITLLFWHWTTLTFKFKFNLISKFIPF